MLLIISNEDEKVENEKEGESFMVILYSIMYYWYHINNVLKLVPSPMARKVAHFSDIFYSPVPPTDISKV